MIDTARASPSQLASQRLDQAALAVGSRDVVVSLVSFATSLAVLVFAMSSLASFPAFIALQVASLFVPGIFLTMRLRRNGELTIPVLLMVTSFACGPLGGLGCAFMALALWRRRPSPSRLRYWYEYIAGIVARDPIVRIYEELSSGRLPSDPASEVPRFRPILHGASTEEQQRVLGVIGRRYHADFRPALRDALRNKNGFIRAQAAAVASRLDSEEKKSLWSGDSPRTGDRAGWVERSDTRRDSEIAER
jgi:hypothetical protein